jgi:signal transduction histidine kinase
MNRPKTTTLFAPAPRKSTVELASDLSTVAASEVVEALLRTSDGLMAVLNAERQIVALNHGLLASLGVRDAGQVLGLRLGESLRCVHRDDHEAGCGCSEFCRTCGAAIAIVAALDAGRIQEQDCIVTTERDGERLDLTFRVKATAIRIDARDFVLVFLQDVTLARLQAELTRVFFHDVANLVQVLQTTCELLGRGDPGQDAVLTQRARTLARRLTHEITIQRALMETGGVTIPMQTERLDAGTVLGDVRALYADHPLTFGKILVVTPPSPDWRVDCDRSLLVRVVGNMVANALEATPLGGTVHLWCRRAGGDLQFCVHNEGAMNPDVARRVFQRHFTTKKGAGRGLGAFAMKLLGERHLAGKVDFETDVSAGTVFRIALPLAAG